MGWMKTLWIELEQARAEDAQEKLGGQMPYYEGVTNLAEQSANAHEVQRQADFYEVNWKVFEVASMANLSPGVAQPVAVLYVGDCLTHLRDSSAVSPLCPKCGTTEWRQFLPAPFARLNQATSALTVGRSTVSCGAISNSSACDWTGRLYELFTLSDVNFLYMEVEDWLTSKGYTVLNSGVYTLPIGDHNPSVEELEADHKAQHPTCEADKEEGTRDVEKFLKEQQDKLMGW